MAGRSRGGFWASFHYVTLISGQLLALTVLIVLQHTLPPDDLAAWGWRVPFAIGGVLAIFVFWIRTGLHETQSFQNARGQERARTAMLFRDYPREALVVMGLTAGGSLTFYAFTTYMQKFLVNTAGFTRDQGTEITAVALVCFMAAQPVFGWLSDKIGRKPLLVAGFGLSTLCVYPIFQAIAGAHDQTTALLLVLVLLLILSGYTSISAVVKAELFPAHIRALGVALSYAMANAVFGGTAEYAALWFKQTGFEQGFYIYVAGVSAVALLVSIMMRDTRRDSRILED